MNQQARPCIVQFGAGNIGRSLVGQLFARAGWEVIFVEAFAPVVEALNSRGRYAVRVKDNIPTGGQEVIWVEGVRALPAQQAEPIAEAIARASLIGTAVGPAALPKVLPAIAAGLGPPQPADLDYLVREPARRGPARPSGLARDFRRRFPSCGARGPGRDKHRQNGPHHARRSARGRPS